MNTIWIVMPILIVLMFLLGTELNKNAFINVVHHPKAVILGMMGQIIVLPAIAFAIAWLFDVPSVYFMGLVLVACCPGGSSSNVFSMLAKGDVALSVTLTAISSIITLFTLPLIMEFTSLFVTQNTGLTIELPVARLLIQNIVLLFVPLMAGWLFRWKFPAQAAKTAKALNKTAFPALMLLAFLFFLQYTQEIIDNFALIGIACGTLIIASMLCSSLLAHMGKLASAVRRTIVIEVGMQNAAQAIAIATSPFIFNNGEMAIPAIIYALLMNVILLLYILKFKQSK
ncbi:MAG: bile acid:sodium symporter family protein [Bacteroidaceae bacterium]|nr:bile acid:sodium symporter family protein [Bacteroidaceae bacterium]